MCSKEKDFAAYLNHYKDVSSNLTDLLAITGRIEKQKAFAELELINRIKQKIALRCSIEFVSIMSREVSKEIKNLSLFSGRKTNLDYLVEVIFRSLTSSSHVIGYDHFIVPGGDYEAGREFHNIFFKDFAKIKKMFNIKSGVVLEVTVGYAMEFYLP